MLRIGLIFLICCAQPAAARAEGLSEDNCRVTGEILRAAIAGRKAGQSAGAIKARLSRGEGAVAAPYTETVGPLVDLVFALEARALSQKVARDYEAQCLAYKP